MTLFHSLPLFNSITPYGKRLLQHEHEAERRQKNARKTRVAISTKARARRIPVTLPKLKFLENDK